MSIINFNDRWERLIPESPNTNLGISVCIPCYNERTVVQSVDSIFQCKAPSACEIIVLINESVEVNPDIQVINQKAYNDLLAYQVKYRDKYIHLFPIYIQNIPVKHAGVGLARKLAMDEAYLRMKSSSSKVKIIACYDADCMCDSSYLKELYSFFEDNEKMDAASIAYAHPIDNAENTQEITNYELHLRYFIEMQRQMNLPFAFHTVGSSMAVRAKAYHAEGGMNRKKAGEDFYFLQKFISKGTCGELHSTTISPSSRESDRVPFGTGRAILKMKSSSEEYKTYNYQSFLLLSQLLERLPVIWKCAEIDVDKILQDIDNEVVKKYLERIGATGAIVGIKNNTTGYPSFCKRFYQWFDAFQLMKYLHYMRDNGFENMSLEQASFWLFSQLDLSTDNDLKERLLSIRHHQKQAKFNGLMQGWS